MTNTPDSELRERIEAIYRKYGYSDTHVSFSPLYEVTTDVIALIQAKVVEARINELRRWKALAKYEEIHEQLNHPSNNMYQSNPLHGRFPKDKACVLCGFAPTMAIKEIDERLAQLKAQTKSGGKT